MGGGSWTGVRSVNGGSGEDEMMMGSFSSSPTLCSLRRFLVPVIGISLCEFVGVGVGRLVVGRGGTDLAESRCPFGLVSYLGISPVASGTFCVDEGTDGQWAALQTMKNGRRLSKEGE